MQSHYSIPPNSCSPAWHVQHVTTEKLTCRLLAFCDPRFSASYKSVRETGLADFILVATYFVLTMFTLPHFCRIQKLFWPGALKIANLPPWPYIRWFRRLSPRTPRQNIGLELGGNEMASQSIQYYIKIANQLMPLIGVPQILLFSRKQKCL